MTAPSPCETGRFTDGTSLASPGGLDLVCRGLDLADLAPGDRVLDLGCGRGGTAAGLRRRRGLDVVGVDRSDPGPGCVEGDAARLPFPRAAARCVLLECALSVMADPAAVLAECARVLVPGGKLIVLDLYARAPPPPGGGRAGSVCLRGRDELLALLTARGFTVLATEDHSPALTALVLRVLFERGSLDEVFGDAGCALRALRPLRPGYLLVVAAAPDST